MSRYRKIEVRTWADERFRALSPFPPSAQGLWFFLLTGPHTGPIPGLFRAGRAAMAEELGWEQEGFDKAFAEVLSQGMAKADFKARLVWLPNALKHNKPESPNVVRSWRAEFDLLPECALKDEALEAIKAFIYGLGDGFSKAFDDAFHANRKPSSKPSAKPMPNQEQEQEQEQNNCAEQFTLAADAPPPVVSIPLNDGSEHPITEAEVAEWIASYPAVDVLQQLRHIRAWCKANPAKRKTKRGVASFIVRWLGKAQDQGGAGPRNTAGNTAPTPLFAGAI